MYDQCLPDKPVALHDNVTGLRLTPEADAAVFGDSHVYATATGVHIIHVTAAAGTVKSTSHI